MEMLQNVSNCHRSDRSRNRSNLPYFIVVLVIIILRGNWAGFKLFGREIMRFLLKFFHVC